MTTKRAMLKWMPKEMGGREKPPPCSVEYPFDPLIRFPDSGEPWPPEQVWTVIIRKVTVFESLEWLVEISYLVAEAPHHLLQQGAKFELYEGKTCVARGEIV
jgi:hypothetical protein